MKTNSRMLVLLTVMVLLVSSCSLFGVQNIIPTDKPDASKPPNVEPSITESPSSEAPVTEGRDASALYGPPFAEYVSIPVRLPEKSAYDYTLPLDLSSVVGLEDLNLTDTQLAMLAKNGFVVASPIPGQYQEFYQVYETFRYRENSTVFATTDAVFHVYHLIFDKMLRDLEKDYFIPNLELLTARMLETLSSQYEGLKGTALEDAALRNLAYFGVAARLLELDVPIPDAALPLVDAEVALIEGHGGAEISPIWDYPEIKPELRLIEDYSQYVPRGHYTRSEALKRYFKAMMWFGRMTFRLRDVQETQRALLLVQAVRNTPDAEYLWAQIYDPTVFIVGKADDLSFHEYGALLDDVYGNSPELTAFADEGLMNQFMEEARKLPPPQVNSMWVWIWEDRDEATQGFRFMGQRFTLDAYVFGQVIYRKVGTDANPRDLPKALDFLAAMGSEEAYSILDDMGETGYENYITQMDKVKTEVASLEMDSWAQNLYWNWLYTFFPLIEPKDEPYPAFMRTQAWIRKDLNTALGSYTELKHDTILYAKQVMAEMGGGMDEPPMGYVEPNPEVYARLNALAQMTYQGLLSRNLLSDTTRNNLDNLIDLLTFLQTVAEKELNGETVSYDEYARLMYFGGELEALTLAAADTTEEYDRDLSDQKAALVADVATGIGRVLEEAIGQPAMIVVIPPDDPTRFSVGAVFTYYEFTVSPDQRMTDETWQGLVESGDTPPSPEWTSLFMTP